MGFLARENNKTSSGSQSAFGQWEAGQDLSFAWYTCVSGAQEREYQAEESDGRREFLRRTMKDDLLRQVADGELLAFGLREGDSPDVGPVLIPRYLFPSSGQDAVDVHWDLNVLVSAGHRYTRIRIAKPSERDSQSTELAPTAMDPHNAEIPARKMGRPRVDEALRSVVRELVGEHRLGGISRKEQINFVRERARQNFPRLFLRPVQPSRTKILQALRAEGL